MALLKCLNLNNIQKKIGKMVRIRVKVWSLFVFLLMICTVMLFRTLVSPLKRSFATTAFRYITLRAFTRINAVVVRVWCRNIMKCAEFNSTTLAINCTTKPNGNYEIGCRSYAICSYGQITIRDCTEDKVYNNATGQCDDPTQVAQPCGLVRDCTNKTDGSYADRETGCSTYYTCYASTYFGHNFCTGGTVFDEVKQVCNWGNNVLPPCGWGQRTTLKANLSRAASDKYLAFWEFLHLPTAKKEPYTKPLVW